MVNHAKIADYYPQAYKGKIKIDGKAKSIIEIATKMELPPILYRRGDWVLTTEGIHCLTVGYEFGKERFNENWPDHMHEKGWVNKGDFLGALAAGKNFQEWKII